ncbi:MAG TPA: 1,2-phenylacetyl-CoA epoxidase subunit PaaD [Jatrophihabitans sp.]|nr:1,2-phenylacetyl-CoA epoxidase subunit PaaD [Jatrophihabitans sp.]
MSAATSRAWAVAAATPDPELPQLTVADLGILRAVDDADGCVVATITPTYSGCPALREISADLEHRLRAAGFKRVEVRAQLSPPWTTDWITPAGRRKLAAAGIAPPAPARRTSGPIPVTLEPRRAVTCPHCGSAATVETAAFSATACKALYRCRSCAEPFEAVKSL